MAKLLDPESKPMLFLGKFWDVFVLHLVWAVCCIPVITFGPATIAFYYAVMRDTRDIGGHYVQDFFRSFKQNFRQGVVLGLIYLIAGGIIGFALYYYAQQSGGMIPVLKGVMFLLALVFLFMFRYLWALVARFENPVPEHMKNALILSIRHLPWTILMCVLLIAVYATAILGFMPILLFGYGLVVYLDSYILNRLFRPFDPDDIPQD